MYTIYIIQYVVVYFYFLPEHLVVRALGDLHGLVFNNASNPIKTIN